LDRAGNAQWICFIDDDEVPERAWLDELLNIQRLYAADVVGGTVVPYFPERVPEWVRRGRFLEYRRHPTGRRLPYVFTNNVLFRAQLLGESRLRFDIRWALTGGEDRHFFQQIGMRGYRIVWADEAVVTEWVPARRATARWILQRGYRYGNTTSCVELDLRPGVWMRLRLLAMGGYRILKGCFLLPFTWPFGWHHAVTYLRHICYGVGLLSGWLGMHYAEYRAVRTS
jgi:hypothetical protein